MKAMSAAQSGTQEKSLLPTRKWWAAFVTSVAGVVVMGISADEFSTEVKIALVWVVVQAAVTWLVPNVDTPGGVPVKKPKA
jgi:hypothetical protein